MLIGLIKNSYNFKLNLDSENDKSRKFKVTNRRTYFVIDSKDNLLKNEITNKNDLSSSSKSTTQSRIKVKLITSNSNQMETITGFQK